MSKNENDADDYEDRDIINPIHDAKTITPEDNQLHIIEGNKEDVADANEIEDTNEIEDKITDDIINNYTTLEDNITGTGTEDQDQNDRNGRPRQRGAGRGIGRYESSFGGSKYSQAVQFLTIKENVRNNI